MRFIFILWLGFFCSLSFAQNAISNESTAAGATSGNASSAAKSTDESATIKVAVQPAATAADMIDTPSAVQASCTEKNGKPCPEWVHKLIGRYPPVDVPERWNGQPDHFFTIGNARRALHPDKTSWMLFAVAHAGMWASTVVAVRNHRTSLEEAHSEYPAAAFMTGMDLLLFKTISPALSVGPAAYATVHYSRAAAR